MKKSLHDSDWITLVKNKSRNGFSYEKESQIEGVSIRSGKGCCCRPERHNLYLAYWLWEVTFIPASSLLRLIESIYLQRMRTTGDMQFFVCRSRIIPEPPFPSQGIAGSWNEIVFLYGRRNRKKNAKKLREKRQQERQIY